MIRILLILLQLLLTHSKLTFWYIIVKFAVVLKCEILYFFIIRVRIFSSYFVKDSEVLCTISWKYLKVLLSFPSFPRRFYVKFCSKCERIWSSINIRLFININRFILISQECKTVEIKNRYDCSLCYEIHIFICTVTNSFIKGRSFNLKSQKYGEFKMKCNFCVKS
jgi:hypothetical protein